MKQDIQYYVIREFYKFKPNVKLIKEAIERGEPIVLSGILQKANTLNRNGRVYPYDILRREATKYMEAVEENRALGECVPAGTEIFTKDGWCKIEDVCIEDEIFTMNVEKNLLEIQSVSDTICKNYNDQMVHIYNNSNLDMMVTKKHKIILWDRNDKPYILTAEELYEKIKQNDSVISHSYIKNSMPFDESDKSEILDRISLNLEFINSELVDFNDFVYCVTVPNKTWLMRYNGKVSWTHNCDHPDCQTADSKILTKEGWKFLPDIKEDEEILTLNLETNKTEIQKIDKKIDVPYKGSMYSVKGSGIDIITTPNHRFLTKNLNGDLKYYTVEELLKTNKRNLKLLKKIDWDGIEYENIKINAVSNDFLPKRIRKDLREKYTKDLYLNSEWFFKFLGFYLSEGNAYGTKGGKGRTGYAIQITQKKEDTVKIIREILTNLSPELKWREVKHHTGTVRFVLNDARLHTYLFKLGNSGEKYIPYEIKQASSNLLNLLLSTFILGDGRTTKRNYHKKDDGSKRQSVFTISEKLIADLQEILLKTGGYGNITKFQPKDRYINDLSSFEEEVENGDGTVSLIKKEIKTKRLISAKNSNVQYFINLASTEYTNLDRVKIEKIDFDDNVYCVRVKNGNFYTMRNGKSFWTGNSAVVSLRQSSHKIIDMWWQGEELYGKVEILDPDCDAARVLRGLLKSNVMLGISSRGVGSVKTVKGEDIVQNDFELIAFDFVSSPSTPGAYLFKEGKQWGMTPISEEHYNKIKWICENGVCRLSDMLDESTNLILPEKQKIILPENKQIITPESCMCEGYNKLYELSNKDFWKNI